MDFFEVLFAKSTGGGSGPGPSPSLMVVQLRFLITARRSGGDSYFQFAELDIALKSGQLPVSAAEAYIGDTYNSVAYLDSSERAIKLFDGNSETKLCCYWNDAGVRVDATLSDPIPLSSIVKYRLQTANDFARRDPISWRLYALTADANLLILDEQVNAAVPTDRFAWSDYFVIGQT